MTLDDLVPPTVTRAVADLGLHKIAGAMLGVPELDLDVALRSLGERAYRRRKEARAIADGIAAYATVTGEKIAENPALMALLRRAAMPALAGAGMAAVPKMLSSDPYEQQQSLMPAMGIGALLGGIGGVAHGMHGLPAPLSQELATALK
jgi:hypothetical protein